MPPQFRAASQAGNSFAFCAIQSKTMPRAVWLHHNAVARTAAIPTCCQAPCLRAHTQTSGGTAAHTPAGCHTCADLIVPYPPVRTENTTDTGYDILCATSILACMQAFVAPKLLLPQALLSLHGAAAPCGTQP